MDRILEGEGSHSHLKDKRASVRATSKRGTLKTGTRDNWTSTRRAEPHHRDFDKFGTSENDVNIGQADISAGQDIGHLSATSTNFSLVQSKQNTSPFHQIRLSPSKPLIGMDMQKIRSSRVSDAYLAHYNCLKYAHDNIEKIAEGESRAIRRADDRNLCTCAYARMQTAHMHTRNNIT